MGSLTPHALRPIHPLSPLDRSRTHFKNCNATGFQITVTHFDQLLNPKAASDSAILGWANERLRMGEGLCPQRKPHGERKVPLEGRRPLKAHPGEYPKGDHVCFYPWPVHRTKEKIRKPTSLGCLSWDLSIRPLADLCRFAVAAHTHLAAERGGAKR